MSLKQLFARYIVIGPTSKSCAFTRSGYLKQMSASRDPSVEVYELIGGRQAVVPVAARSIG
jgi:hypothetical protein